MRNITVGIYSKHLIFWIVVGLALLGARSFLANRSIGADIVSYPESAGSYYIKIDEKGTVFLNSRLVPKALNPQKNLDQVRLVLIDKPTEYIPYAEIYLVLPEGVSADAVDAIPRLVHNPATAVAKSQVNQNTLLFTARDIDQSAALSLEINFKKGQLRLSFWRALLAKLQNQPLFIWLIVALAMPAVGLIALLAVVWKSLETARHIKAVKPLDRPPSQDPPALGEALTKSHLSARSLAGTLIDLANRGYIVIGEQGNSFVLGKHKPFALPSQTSLVQSDSLEDTAKILGAVAAIVDETDLKYYERLLLSKLFTKESRLADKQAIAERVGHRLFSEKIAEFYHEIYRLGVQENYFIENPAKYHRKFKLVGLALFFLGIAGFALGVIKFPEPKTTVFLWVGMILSSLLILKIGPSLPILSPRGLQAYRAWLGFKLFLRDPQPIPYRQSSRDLFERYLPYAVVLGAEKEWTARFRNQPFAPPGWFVSEENIQTVEEFDRKLFPLVGWLGTALTAAKAPVVD